MFGFSKEEKAARLARRAEINERFKAKMTAIDSKLESDLAEIAVAKDANKARYENEKRVNNAAFKAQITAINKR